MLVRAIADQHGFLPEVEPCDLLLIAGDICPVKDHTIPRQRSWLTKQFRAWLEEVPATHIVGVAGNHDFIFEQEPQLVPDNLRWTYLRDSSTEIEGLKIYGTPWQPWFYDWAFNLREPELEEKWKLIPDDTDILLLHGPPSNHGDRTQRGERVGSPSLMQAIRRVKPKLSVYGHIHEDHGQWDVDGMTLANVTVVDLYYELTYPPTEFEL